MTADQIRSLQPALAALAAQFRGCFKTDQTFSHWQKYLLGLMADLKRKSIEPIALAGGGESTDHSGAGGRGGRRPGVENLEPVLALPC